MQTCLTFCVKICRWCKSLIKVDGSSQFSSGGALRANSGTKPFYRPSNRPLLYFYNAYAQRASHFTANHESWHISYMWICISLSHRNSIYIQRLLSEICFTSKVEGLAGHATGRTSQCGAKKVTGNVNKKISFWQVHEKSIHFSHIRYWHFENGPDRGCNHQETILYVKYKLPTRHITVGWKLELGHKGRPS